MRDFGSAESRLDAFINVFHKPPCSFYHRNSPSAYLLGVSVSCCPDDLCRVQDGARGNGSHCCHVADIRDEPAMMESLPGCEEWGERY